MSATKAFDDQKMCDDAMFVQDACNLLAVVGSFHRHLKTMREAGLDGDGICNHPVSVMYSSKIESLTNSDDAFSKAHDYCYEKTK